MDTISCAKVVEETMSSVEWRYLAPVITGLVVGGLSMVGTYIVQCFSLKNIQATLTNNLLLEEQKTKLNLLLEKQKARSNFITKQYLEPIFDFIDSDIEYLKKISMLGNIKERKEVINDDIYSENSAKVLSILSSVNTFEDDKLEKLLYEFSGIRSKLNNMALSLEFQMLNSHELVSQAIRTSTKIKVILLDKL
ncbi:hypothetical protein [Xenorhabdus bovienii]|uniref:hypothetical protein n=1 Tax=Xenorhabdus bovienii TaxID=40576 RepID=UPI0004D84366|nr:hypothetical protein [Xenorhabdus bovienii]CDG88422.1 hypothetical protein XBFFR1_2090019 [Xenorhabdus bovienii str. feltiae France]CDG93856.1 hypothetical protein XBFFL1_2750018 [Xenorhabdus bovienii str. feltiae Florida]